MDLIDQAYDGLHTPPSASENHQNALVALVARVRVNMNVRPGSKRVAIIFSSLMYNAEPVGNILNALNLHRNHILTFTFHTIQPYPYSFNRVRTPTLIAKIISPQPIYCL